MAIGCSLFDENNKRVEAVGKLVAFADVALGSDCLARALALGALSLELLNKSRRDLLLFNCNSLPFALGAGRHVARVVGPRPAAVRTNDFASVGDFEVLALVEFLEGGSNLEVDAGA